MHRPLLAVLAAAALAGCAALNEPAQFAVERYGGSNVLEYVLSKVNAEENRAPACPLVSGCQRGLPSAEALAREPALDSKGYVMSKAYALQDAGIDEARMRVAKVEILRAPRPVLLTEDPVLLDMLYRRDSAVPGILALESRFSPARDLVTEEHYVLVVDNKYVLDNDGSALRDLAEYQRFSPQLAALPPTLMAQARSNASRGSTRPAPQR